MKITTNALNFQKYFFLYKLFPKLENSYNYWKVKADFGTAKSVNPLV